MNITAEYEARLAEPSDIQGHMEFLRETAAAYYRPVIIELGVRSGQSTACFLAGITAAGGELWSVDVNDPDVPGHWHDLACWHFLKADDRGAEAQAWLPSACDILFIDTSHQYEHTLEELRLYVPRVREVGCVVREGGCVLMHDTELTPDDDPDAQPNVARALDDYCKEAGLSWQNRPGSYGLGIIRP